MGSTIGSLQIAYSGLSAAQLGIDVTGQNTANALTPGYIRQKVTLTPAGPPGQVGPAPGSLQSGQGVRVTGIAQLGSRLLDAQVLATNGAAAASSVHSTVLSQIQTTLGEPSSDALSGTLNGFWSAWQEVSNQPTSAAAASALLGQANTLADQITSTYRSLEQQWSATRQDLATGAAQLNADADHVARLNQAIRSTINAGDSADELIVQRGTVLAQMASLAGASVSYNDDHTVNVSIGGTNIVQSTAARQVTLAGATGMGGVEPDAGAADPPRLVWADPPDGTTIALDGGQLGADVAVLSPAAGGGAIATTAHALNTLARSLATQVNAITTGATSATAADGTPGSTGHAFFTVGGPTDSAALTLQVAATDMSQIGVTAAGGAIGSAADQVSQLGTQAGSPDAGWAASVITLGTSAQTANRQADLDTAAQTAATHAQQSQESVDLDQESVNLIAYQQAYEANARVISTMNSVLGDLMSLVAPGA